MSTKKKPAILDRAEFRAWLKLHPNVGIGYPRSANNCPLAIYLRAHGHPLAMVCRVTFSLARLDRPLPRWAIDFVSGIDETFKSTSVSIHGKQALRILDNIKESIDDTP